MSDHQQIPGNIRSFLATKARVWTEQTADAAVVYANLCDETNQRLRRCAEYLRRGMKSAAIHLADCQPNLFAAVSSLNFPERSAWADICVTHGMAPPPVLEDECLPDLKQAYEQEHLLEPLLSRHRLLAIARAPTSQRLEVARLLAEAEPENPAWSEEVRGLEAMRIRELGDEGGVALADGDMAVIAPLLEEAASPRWRALPPPALRASLQKAIDEDKARRASERAPALAEAISKQFAADANSAELPQLLEQWRTLIDMPGVIVSQELVSQVASAMDRKPEPKQAEPERNAIGSQEEEATAPSEPATAHRRFELWWFVAPAAIAIVAAALYYFRYLHS